MAVRGRLSRRRASEPGARSHLGGRARLGVLALGLAVLSTVVSACGRGGSTNPYSLPEYDGAHPQAGTSAVASAPAPTPAGTAAKQLVPSAPASSAPAAVTYRPADPWGEGAWVERGRIVARTAEQKAVVAAWVKYMSLRVQLSNTWQVNESALAAVASGSALSSAQQRAQSQREQERRSVGRFIVNVSSVRINGDQAAVAGCNFDATTEVDQYGIVLIPPPGGVLTTMNVQRTGNTWRVTSWPTTARTCDWRR